VCNLKKELVYLAVITAEVRNRRAVLCGHPVLVCGNSGYVLQFIFGDEWDMQGEKMAVFAFCRDGVMHFESVPLNGNCCSVPVLQNVQEVRVSLRAGGERAVSEFRIPCLGCITDPCAAPAPASHDFFCELTEEMNQLMKPSHRRRSFVLCDADGRILHDSSGSVICVRG